MKLFKANDAIFALENFEAFELAKGMVKVKTPFDINEHPEALKAYQEAVKAMQEGDVLPVPQTEIEQDVPCWEIRFVRKGGQAGYAWVQHMSENDAKQMWLDLQAALLK